MKAIDKYKEFEAKAKAKGNGSPDELCDACNAEVVEYKFEEMLELVQYIASTYLDKYYERRLGESFYGALLEKYEDLDEEFILPILRLGSCESVRIDEWYTRYPAQKMVRAVEVLKEKGELSENILEALKQFKARLFNKTSSSEVPFGKKVNLELLKSIKSLIGGIESTVDIDKGEAWADFVFKRLQEDKEMTGAITELMNHCVKSNSSSPSTKWLKDANTIIQQGNEYFSEFLISILDKALRGGSILNPSFHDDKYKLYTMNNSMTLKGLIWTCSLLPSSEMALAVGNLARYCFTKIATYGDVDTKCGNACMSTLSLIPLSQAIIQISLLKNKFKKVSQIKQADKALKNAAELAGMTESDLLEISVPDYGLVNGEKDIDFDDKRVRLYVSKTDAKLEWHSGDKIVKSVPASVRSDFSAELKELKATVKEMSSVLSSEKVRLESLLKLPKEWDYNSWCERYLDQALIQDMVKRMIWTLINGVERQAVMYIDEKFIDSNGAVVSVSEEMRVAPWHPINSSADEVLAWRTFLQNKQITQPFKQAHREIYVLTDAERNTGTYSNRFAAHIIKQHQFRALLEQRRWKAGNIIGHWDAGDTNCSQEIPEYGLTAELWIDYCDIPETNDMGIYMYVVTDQVRFYKTGSDEPMNLEEVPSLALSETMRDVDLFVGVTSVGNDPNWVMRDQNNYWQDYSFGELSVSAESRKTILEALLPSLKIAKQCQIDGRFLKVTGKLKTYKIHMGSSNILMEPNDEYLCIVQDAKKSKNDVYLPFEGDRMLSVILSKAILLANDSKIKDPTIVSQIT